MRNLRSRYLHLINNRSRHLMKMLISLVLCLYAHTVFAGPGVLFSDTSSIKQNIGRNLQILEDKSNSLSVEDVIRSNDFKQSAADVPILGVSTSTFWVKFTVTNTSNESSLLLELSQPTMEEVALYTQQPDGRFTVQKSGISLPFSARRYSNQNYIFDLSILKDHSATYFIKVKSSDQIMLPLSIGIPKKILEFASLKDMLFGIFFGLMMVMILYNLFVYFSVRDSSYIFYVIYILLVCLLQTTLQGYAHRFLWTDNYWLTKNSVFILPSLAGIAAMVFSKVFLQTANIVPLLDKILKALIAVFCIAIILVFAGSYKLSFGIMQLDTMIGSLFVLYLSYRVYRKGNQTALFFLIGWSVLLVGAIIFVLKDFAVFPYNILTNSILEIGTAAEVILLSFALADKINVFRKEKEASQAQALLALQENERIVREQNVILEKKVNERTYELKVANDDLSTAMTELKEAESQLVESEKMASLGQLTAGIAHEINNPINFVTSNVKPLNRDVQILLEAVDAMEHMVLNDDSATIEDRKKKIEQYKADIDYDYLKEEIDQLLSGIGEGASRTAEIVKGLRIFSRLDEDALKKADINECLDSTLIITNNLLSNLIKVEKVYGNLPAVECYPGKLNQVFLNIISNAIYAIKKKFGEQNGGQLTITTYHDEENVYIKIGDNGTGMDEHTKKKLFEPFFTTKDVGEGTGLGMSIAYNTINKHNGQIKVDSEIGVGTDFILILPLIQK